MKLAHKIILLPCLSALLFCIGLIGENGQGVSGWWVGVNVITVTLITGFAWYIARGISTPIAHITSIVKQIATGDISSAAADAVTLCGQTDTPSSDEIAQLAVAVRTMTTNLNTLVSQVQHSGLQVTSSSKALSNLGRQQEQTLNHQTKSIQHVQDSMADISSIAVQLVHTTRQVTTILEDTTNLASSGQSDLQRLAEVMQHIKDSSQVISSKLASIHQKASKISKVTTTVSNVAQQTNLLSINAAIEAEKAGEVGRGFSVVAQEVRRLSKQTSLATVEIKQTINEMHTAVSEGMLEMDNFVMEVRENVDHVSKISTQLNTIIQQVQGMLPQFDKVNTAMEHQSHTTIQINKAMGQLGNEMQDTMTSLRNSHGMIEQLNNAATTLEDSVSRFEISFTIFKEVDIFKPFSEEAIDSLSECIQSRHFSAGDTIIRQGERGSSLFLLARGTVDVMVRLPEGNTVKVAQVSSGDVVGEMALLMGEPRSATLICATDTHVFEITKDDIAPFIARQPGLMESLSQVLTKRKIELAAKRNRQQAQQIDHNALYQQTLQRVQSFFTES